MYIINYVDTESAQKTSVLADMKNQFYTCTGFTQAL